MPSVATNWYSLLADCLAEIERAQAGAAYPVVDHEIVTAANGGPEDLRVWLICRTPEQMQQFSDSELGRTLSELRRKLLQRGFPEDALASLSVQVTSRTEIDRSGGRIARLR